MCIVDRLGGEPIPSMRFPKILAFILSLSALFFCSCANIDTTPEPRGERTLTGNVLFRSEGVMPVGTKALVRLLDVTRADSLPVVLAEQTIDPVLASPVAFSLDYRAEDIVPPRRARLEARISINGKMRYYTVNALSVGVANASHPLEIWVEEVAH